MKNRPAQRPDLLPLLSGVLALFLMFAGCGGGGGGSTASAPPSGAPDPPGIVVATGAAGSISVTWSPATGATSYNLYWSAAPGVTKANGVRVVNATSPFLHGGLPGGATCYYVVTSVDNRGIEGVESDEASATATAPLAGPDIGQYFDRAVRAPGPGNYDDRSSHPLRGLTTPDNALLYGAGNCLACHYASGPARSSDECLKCHFEVQPNAPSTNHMDGILQLANPSGDALPTTAATIATIEEYDDWCLRCHASTAISLGGVFPSSARRTAIDPAAFANSRHRAQNPPVGCVHCHHPHGRGNTRIVRENPENRRAAGETPSKFGVFPADNLSGGSYGLAQSVPYRARVDNALPNVYADADDDQAYCNKACHVAKFSPGFSKEKVIRRDGVTGNFVLAPGNRKVYLINGQEYTVDNITLVTNRHVHPNGEVITTDNMVSDYAAIIGLTGPSYYRYPDLGGAAPGAYTLTRNAASPLPFFPDFGDASRDFTNAWNSLGVTIKYRFTCSTCHNPHGTTLQNTPGGISSGSGFPDLRLSRTNPADLCLRCHK